MHPDIRSQRFDDARKRLQEIAEELADKAGDESVREKALAIEQPISGAVEPQTRDLLKLEATVETLEAAVEALGGPSASVSSASSEAHYDFSEAVGEDGNDSLHAAGYTELDDVQNASDAELLEVDGIGPARLQKLRSL